MTSFTLDHALRIAGNTFRFRPDRFGSADQQKRCGEADRPLVGKEQELLEALRADEQRYEQCKAEIRVIRKLRRSDADLPEWCANVADDLETIVESLASLDGISQDELDSIARKQGHSLEEIRGYLEKALSWAEDGAEELFPKPQKTRGRKPGVGKGNVQLVPLEEFAKEIRSFWLRETGFKFSFEATTRYDLDPIIREPTSAATRLLYDACRILDDRVDVIHIEALIRVINKNPEFRKELLGDPAVDALTG
jgi:hypothetical protein